MRSVVRRSRLEGVAHKAWVPVLQHGCPTYPAKWGTPAIVGRNAIRLIPSEGPGVTNVIDPDGLRSDFALTGAGPPKSLIPRSGSCVAFQDPQ
jgi:hypothetical protein